MSMLYSHAHFGEYDKISERIKSHPHEAHYRDQNGNTALHCLITKSNAPTQLVKELANVYPAALMTTGSQNRTPLDLSLLRAPPDEQLITFLKSKMASMTFIDIEQSGNLDVEFKDNTVRVSLSGSCDTSCETTMVEKFNEAKLGKMITLNKDKNILSFELWDDNTIVTEEVLDKNSIFDDDSYLQSVPSTLDVLEQDFKNMETEEVMIHARMLAGVCCQLRSENERLKTGQYSHSAISNNPIAQILGELDVAERELDDESEPIDDKKFHDDEEILLNDDALSKLTTCQLRARMLSCAGDRKHLKEKLKNTTYKLKESRRQLQELAEYSESCSSYSSREIEALQNQVNEFKFTNVEKNSQIKIVVDKCNNLETQNTALRLKSISMENTHKKNLRDMIVLANAVEDLRSKQKKSLSETDIDYHGTSVDYCGKLDEMAKTIEELNNEASIRSGVCANIQTENEYLKATLGKAELTMAKNKKHMITLMKAVERMCA